MKNVIIRGLTDEVYNSVRLEAIVNRRSAEAQMRLILERAMLPAGRLLMGSELRKISRMVGGLTCAMLRDQRRDER